MGREATMRQLEMAELNAPMEAFQEGVQMDQFERARQMQTTQVQQAQTLFEQAQSGWVQNEDGTWTNIDKQTQDALSLQAINATQRAELLGEIQYWQALSSDENQSSEVRDQAKATLAQLQTDYAKLLADSQTVPIPGRTPTTDEDEDGDDDPETIATIGSTRTNEDGVTETFNGTTWNVVTKTPTEWVNSFVQDFTAAGLDDLTIRKSQFKNSVVENQTDLARLVTSLAPESAKNDPGYNYAYEKDLVQRAVTDVTSLTFEEATRLNEFTSSAGSFEPPWIGGDLYNINGIIPKTESTDAFVDYLVDQGIFKLTDIETDDRKGLFQRIFDLNQPMIRNAVSGSVAALDNYDDIYRLTGNAVQKDITIPGNAFGGSGEDLVFSPTKSNTGELVNLYRRFLNDYNTQKQGV
jgi:hypothetical protein